jgi:hypothetical protein
MEACILDRIRSGLLQKREWITEWLHSTPLNKKEVCNGQVKTDTIHQATFKSSICSNSIGLL